MVLTFRGDFTSAVTGTYSTCAASRATLSASASADLSVFLLVFGAVFTLDSVADIIDPKTFSPVESITRCAISPRVGVLKLILTDFARLLTQL